MTTFGDQVFQMGGVPVGWAGRNPFGKHYFVDAKRGSDSNSGRKATKPKQTVESVFDVVGSGDYIWLMGKVREELSTPAGVFDVTMIGATNPRHPDDHTESGRARGSSGAAWVVAASPTAATPLLTVRQQGWRFENILWDGPADAAAVQLFRDAGSGDDEDDASHAIFYGCKFVAGQNHIEVKGGLSQVKLYYNQFFGATADSILETTGAGVGTNNHFEIAGNNWKDNATHIDVGLNYASVYGNTFGYFSSMSVDLTGGNKNMVWGNLMSGDYDAKYVAGTGDEWPGNYSMDVSSDEVGAEGLTIAVPVA